MITQIKYKLFKFLLFILIYFSTNLYANDGNLYRIFKDYPVIKVYLKEITNDADNSDVEINIFRNIFKLVIEKRKNIKFEYITDETKADVIINLKIKRYSFTKEAMPLFFSSASLAADMTAPKSSGTLIVDYEIINPKDSKVLLFYPNFTTVSRRPREHTKGKMGFGHAVRKNVNRFIFRAFYEQRD